jgi:hypothetical protein
VTEEPIYFTREVVVTQLAARTALRRGLATIAVCLAVFWLVTYVAAKYLGLPDYLWAASVFVPLIVTLFALRQLQWSILSSHRLRCPYCQHLLATERRWWNSPGPSCKACGKLALLPNAVLNEAAAT